MAAVLSCGSAPETAPVPQPDTVTVPAPITRAEEEFIPEKLGGRIAASLSGSIKNLRTGGGDFIVWLAGAAPVILILAAIGFAAVKVVRKRVKKAQNNP